MPSSSNVNKKKESSVVKNSKRNSLRGKSVTDTKPKRLSKTANKKSDDRKNVSSEDPGPVVSKTNELNLNVKHGEKESNRYYMRLNVIDKSGVLAGVTEIFRKYALSIESLLQRGRNPNEEVPVVITTHETDYDTLQSVMKDLTNSKELISKPVCMKII